MIANILLYLLILIYFITLPRIFAKAGYEKPMHGYIPVYNLYIWLKIMKKPWWWMILMIIPGVNFLMIFVLNVELARAFNLRSTADALKIIVLPWYFVYEIAFKPEIKFVGPMDFTKTKKSRPREWGDAILFAVIAATIIRTFFLEAFKIPTPSMEKNLLVGDFLFVSKISYGAKLPETPISFPFAHNTLPVVESKSYLEIFTLPYLRLPGLGSVERNDVVVFNFPAGDSVIVDNTNVTYYQQIVDEAFAMYLSQFPEKSTPEGFRTHDLSSLETDFAHDFSAKKSLYTNQVRSVYLKQDKLIHRPVDKCDNYIKRCVGIPGDVIEIKDRQLYVNGAISGNTDSMQFNYRVFTGTTIPKTNPASQSEISFKQMLKKKYGVSMSDVFYLGGGVIVLPLTNTNLKKFQAVYGETNVQPFIKGKGHYLDPARNYEERFCPVFPNDIQYDWTEDNFGPLKIPAKGETVELNKLTLPVYRRIIEVYEHNTLEIKGDDIFVNGAKATSYTMKQNYYWMMGDNRQNSADSRFWGFVPYTHVVGKALMVWMSSDPESGVRWNRIFHMVH